MPCRRRRCRANSKTTFGQCFVFAVIGVLASRRGASPALPPLSAAVTSVILRNIAIGPWLRYLSPKISNFVLLKIDCWP